MVTEHMIPTGGPSYTAHRSLQSCKTLGAYLSPDDQCWVTIWCCVESPSSAVPGCCYTVQRWNKMPLWCCCHTTHLSCFPQCTQAV